jgi:hypothetical protein
MSTYPTAGGYNGIKRSASPWSDLPDDLLGKVLSRIVSPRDRVRFAAVCGPWRAVASRQPPLAAPLLLLSSDGKYKTKHLCGPDDSWVFRAPSKAANSRPVGSHDGGWIALLDNDSHRLTIMNLFSAAEVAPSQLQRELTVMWSLLNIDVSKIIFSGDPASSDGCVLAAIVDGWLYITLCRHGCHRARWTSCPRDEDLTDIAFCNGELYGLARSNEVLFKFEIGMEGDSVLEVTAIQRLAIQRPKTFDQGYMSYIFELHGKTSMAVRARWLPNHAHFFKVFKLVDAHADEVYKHKWAEVTGFGDYALFIGPTRSKVVHVPTSVEHCGLERNHIYYTKYTHSWVSKLPEDALYSVTSDDGDQIKMYSKKDQSFGDGVERTGYYVHGCNYAMWVGLPDM